MHNQFKSLDQFLIQHQPYWRFEAFFSCLDNDLPWKDTNPELCSWLESLSPQQIERYKQDNQSLIGELTPFLNFLDQLQHWTTLPSQDKQGLTLSRGVENGVPGRKLEQIVSMGEAVLRDHHGSEWLEWCSGKGFLGRILASQTQHKVLSFEYQKPLCDAGQQEADKQHLPMHFVCGDAFSDEAANVVNSKQHAVALHACGDLHVSLLHHATCKSLPAITFSPCCYHLINAEEYQALSVIGKASSLALSKSELRIPLQETVTGGERVKRHRIEEMSYRLGFDLLLRAELGFDCYQPVPSIKKSLLADGFMAFCQWASDKKGIDLPDIDFRYYEQLGREKYWQMERISLVQQAFRRSLEMWLVLDKALFLNESGYHVQISEFCSRETTPRNILIHAVKV